MVDFFSVRGIEIGFFNCSVNFFMSVYISWRSLSTFEAVSGFLSLLCSLSEKPMLFSTFLPRRISEAGLWWSLFVSTLFFGLWYEFSTSSGIVFLGLSGLSGGKWMALLFSPPFEFVFTPLFTVFLVSMIWSPSKTMDESFWFVVIYLTFVWVGTTNDDLFWKTYPSVSFFNIICFVLF